MIISYYNYFIAVALGFPLRDTTLCFLRMISIKTALSKHFRSCGEVTDISIRRSSAFIYIMGEGAGDKATELSGSDMGGGWKVVAKVDSVPGEYHDEDPPMFIG